MGDTESWRIEHRIEFNDEDLTAINCKFGTKLLDMGSVLGDGTVLAVTHDRTDDWTVFAIEPWAFLKTVPSPATDAVNCSALCGELVVLGLQNGTLEVVSPKTWERVRVLPCCTP